MTRVHYTVHYWVSLVYLGESTYTSVLGGTVLVYLWCIHLLVYHCTGAVWGSPYVWCHGQSGRNDASHTRRSTRPEKNWVFLLIFLWKKLSQYLLHLLGFERSKKNLQVTPDVEWDQRETVFFLFSSTCITCFLTQRWSSHYKLSYCLNLHF